MRKLILVTVVALASVSASAAEKHKSAHALSRSAKAVSHASIASTSKLALRGASYPLRHPVKTAKAVF